MGPDLSYGGLMRLWDRMRQDRAVREGEWKQIADVFLPQKTFSYDVPGETTHMPRRTMSSVPQRALTKFAAMLVGYLVDPTKPFLGANVELGLRQAGRAGGPDEAARDYIDDLEWQVFSQMMLPRSGFMASLSSAALELGAFGNAVVSCQRMRGFGPRFSARPLRACWFSANEDGLVDTLFYLTALPLETLVQRFPEAAKVEKIAQKLQAAREKGGAAGALNEKVKVLYACLPRPGGEVGALAARKPYAHAVLLPDHKDAIVETGGYDSFPYGVARLRVPDGSSYGQGPAWQALAPAYMYNRMLYLTEFGLASAVAPPMFMPGRLFGDRGINRNPGSATSYDPRALGFAALKDVIQHMPQAGNPMLGVEYLRLLAAEVEEPFSIDWMRLRDSGNVTAEEINYRRTLNMTGQTATLVSIDRELMGVLGDRALEVSVQEGLIAPPPPSLSGIEVSWDYRGPLFNAQSRNQVEALMQVLNVANLAQSLDPASTEILALEEGIRALAESTGAPPSMIRPREVVLESRARRQQQEAEAQAAQTAAQAGAALRDGAQGLASLSAIAGGEGGGPAALPPGLAA